MAENRADTLVRMRYPELSREDVKSLFENKKVLYDGRPVQKGNLLTDPSKLEVRDPPLPFKILTNPDLPVQLNSNSISWFALEKPPAMHTHPLKRDETQTLANYAVSLYPECQSVGGYREGGACHRLDYETSGLILFAKTENTYKLLRAQFSQKTTLSKYYLAQVEGEFQQDEKIDLFHELDTSHPKVTLYDSRRSKSTPTPAHLQLKAICTNPQITLLLIKLLTGVRHQIRFQLSHLGHPIQGDTLYGGSPLANPTSGICLHHVTFQFLCPDTQELKSLTTPLPTRFQLGDSSLESRVKNLIISW